MKDLRYSRRGQALARKQGQRNKREASTFDRARDELFSAIRQCGVMDADEKEREEWMSETLGYMAERHPELSKSELEQLRTTGLQFCGPVIPHGKNPTAVTLEGVPAT
ncbi:MAG TPA: hypothetical protein VMM79_15475 [Longimicrobiales bacterium]|nr:hypothetical protein [Longimicrobiales bacterium]